MHSLLTNIGHIYQRLLVKIAPLMAFVRSPRGRRLLRLLGYGLMALALLFIALTLAASWQQVQPYLATINLRLLLWAQLCTLLAYLLGGLLWLMVLRGFAIDVRWQRGLLTHFVANAAKYIPGYGWQYISKGMLLREQGKGPRAITLILMTEVVLLLSSGVVAALLAGALVGQRWSYTWRLAPWIWWAGVVGVLMGTGLWNQFVLRSVAKSQATSQSTPPQSVSHQTLQTIRRAMGFKRATRIGNILRQQRLLWIGWGISFVGWLWFAAATLLLVNALSGITNSLTMAVDFLYSLFALVASGIVSILVIIVPGGFGVREATLAALLDGLLPFTVATVVSILMRLLVIASECIGLICLPFLLKAHSTPVKSQ